MTMTPFAFILEYVSSALSLALKRGAFYISFVVSKYSYFVNKLCCNTIPKHVPEGNSDVVLRSD